MQRPPLPEDARIDWDHVLLVASYSESGELLSTTYSVDPSFPKVDVVVNDIVMGTNVVSRDSKMYSVPDDMNDLHSKLEFAKVHNGWLASGFYVKEGIKRRPSDWALELRRIKGREMGLFSFISRDTNESISCLSDLPKDIQVTKMVYKDREGNIHVSTEDEYEGDGVFGGIDIYEAVTWMNDLQIDSFEDTRSPILKAIPRELRDSGIDFADKTASDGEYPQLFLGKVPLLDQISFKKMPKSCPEQGLVWPE